MDEIPVVIDLARERRKRFERARSEDELAIIGFDAYGNPIPLCEKRHASYGLNAASIPTKDEGSAHDHMKRMLEPHLGRLIQTDARLVRRLGLFPRPRLLERPDKGGLADA